MIGEFFYMKNTVLPLIDAFDKIKPKNICSGCKFAEFTVSTWQKLLFSEKFSDVTFVCKDGTTICAHQNILSAASPYFETYFTGPWAKQNPDGQWETEIEADVLKLVLTYIYTGNFGRSFLGMSVDTGCRLLQIGQEFQMPDLVEVCCKVLSASLVLENIKKITCLSATITPPIAGKTNLRKHCMDFIRDHACQLLADTNFHAIATENQDVWIRICHGLCPPTNEAAADTTNASSD